MKRYEVYRNLHKECWSIREAKSKLVVGHAKEVRLFDCEFKVSEAGRQRVLRERKKNVHAVIQGELVEVKKFKSFKGRTIETNDTPKGYRYLYHYEVFYNPFKNDSFVSGRMPIYSAPMVYMNREFRVGAHEEAYHVY